MVFSPFGFWDIFLSVLIVTAPVAILLPLVLDQEGSLLKNNNKSAESEGGITRRALNQVDHSPHELQDIPAETLVCLDSTPTPGALPTVSSLFRVILTSSHTKKPSMAFALAAAPLRSRSNQEAWNNGSVDFSMQLNYCCSWASLTAKLCAQWQRGWLSDSLNYIQITLSHFSRDPSVHLQAL